MSTVKKPVFHQSELSRFEFCAYSLFLERVEKRKPQASFYSARGNGAHTAREVNFRQKIKTGTDLDLGTMADAARDYLNRRNKHGGINLVAPEYGTSNPKLAIGRLDC